MLTQLRIRNFKAWQDTGNIRLAPLTVFFGTNSSGKTSLFQLLLMLKQTVQSTDRRRVLFFGDQHSLVDLGGWQDVVFRHEEQRTLGFELQWDSLNPAEAVSGQPERLAWTGLRFSAEVSSPGPEHSRVVVDQLVYQAVAPGISPHVRMYRVGSDSHDTSYGISGYDITSDGTEHPPVRFYGFPRDAFALFGNAERLITDWVLQLELTVESVHYLGPIRTPPERTCIWRGTPPDDVGRFGEQTVSAMLAARKLRFRLNAEGQEAKTMEFEVIIAQWLRKMGLLESFEVRSLAPSGKEYKYPFTGHLVCEHEHASFEGLLGTHLEGAGLSTAGVKVRQGGTCASVSPLPRLAACSRPSRLSGRCAPSDSLRGAPSGWP